MAPKKPGARLRSTQLPKGRRQQGDAPDIRPRLIPRETLDINTAIEQDWGGSNASPEGARQNMLVRLWSLRLRAGAAIAVCGLAAIWVLSIDLGQEDTPTIADDAPPPLPPSETFEPNEVVAQFLDPSTSEADRLRILRGPYDLLTVRDHFAELQKNIESGVDSNDFFGQAQMLDIGYHGYYVRFRNGDERYLCAVEEPGGFKIDWEAYARIGSRTWDDLTAGSVQNANMHVMVTPGVYYNFEFLDSDAFTAFVLSSPDYEHDVFGYVRRHSTTEDIITATLNEIGRNEKHPVLMKLKLEPIGDSYRRRQFLVSHVVANSWVTSSVGTVEDLWVDSGSPLDQTSIDVAVSSAQLMYQEGLALRFSDPKGAMRFFTKALEYQSDHIGARLALGVVLAEQGDLAAAEDEMNIVLKHDPSNAQAHYQIANCAIRKGAFDDALPHFEATVEFDPNHEAGLNDLAWLLATHKNPEFRIQPRVVAHAERAEKLASKSALPSILGTLGVAYAAAGRFEDAIEATDRALGLIQELGNNSALEAKLTSRRSLFISRKPYLPPQN